MTLTATGVILGRLLGHLGAEKIGHWLADSPWAEHSGTVRVRKFALALAALGLGVMAAPLAASRARIGGIAATLSQRLIPWTNYEPWRNAYDLVKL